ncbi:hypothetical protein T12_5534 [Trichinella patagoniensis]|uniref:Uncharacterized protein n=1 Tax=Trichinella patagoniensis TaxID=990121 RepID=A0A0V0ZLQ8_9BILA|nr:hypothetical protein T12_5534 [Trichinella patagoniensis]
MIRFLGKEEDFAFGIVLITITIYPSKEDYGSASVGASVCCWSLNLAVMNRRQSLFGVVNKHCILYLSFDCDNVTEERGAETGGYDRTEKPADRQRPVVA